ncbi:minor tail protein [Gordonia phage Dogfish]|nr:minor tail protein [Gordonia phage Dogfish]
MSADLGEYLGEVLLKCKVYGLRTPPGEPPLMMGQLSIAGNDAALAVPVLQGDPGDQGQPAQPFKWQFPSLDSTSELPPLTNTPTDIGKSYVIKDGTGTADVAYWNGLEWKYFADAFGPGLPGPTPDITVTGELVDEEDPFEVVVSGSDEAPHFHFKMPATPGPPGVTGPWFLFDDTETRNAGDVPMWSTDDAKFVPRSLLEMGSFPRVLRHTQPESAFTAYSGTAASQQISTMALPALESAYQVDVHGHVRVGRNGLSSAQVAIVVRLGDPTTGQIIAKGLAVDSGPCIISPHYSSQSSGQTGWASSPDGALGRVPAATATNLYVTALRESGGGSWYANAVDAQLSVTLLPAVE